MKIKNILKPKIIIYSILIAQIIIYSMFALRIVDSYKIKGVSTNFIGYLYIIAVYISLIITNSFITEKKIYKVRVIKYTRIYVVTYVLTLLAIIGLLGLTRDMMSKFQWSSIRTILFTNDTKNYLNYGDGYIPLITMSIIPIILIVISWKRNFKNIILLSVNYSILIISGILLNSRIMILQPIIYAIIIVFRKKYYSKKISMKKVIIFFVSVTLVLIYTSGVRDFKEDGKYYTDSKIKWGISRVLDYPISTINYSLQMVSLENDDHEINNVFEILKRIDNKEQEVNVKIFDMRNTYGALEYTNLGAIGQVYSGFSIFSIIIFIIYGIVIRKAYTSFNSGRVLGMMIYPIVLYSLAEFWRLFFIGTEQISIILIVLIITYFFTKNCFKYEECL